MKVILLLFSDMERWTVVSEMPKILRVSDLDDSTCPFVLSVSPDRLLKFFSQCGIGEGRVRNITTVLRRGDQKEHNASWHTATKTLDFVGESIWWTLQKKRQEIKDLQILDSSSDQQQDLLDSRVQEATKRRMAYILAHETKHIKDSYNLPLQLLQLPIMAPLTLSAILANWYINNGFQVLPTDPSLGWLFKFMLGVVPSASITAYVDINFTYNRLYNLQPSEIRANRFARHICDTTIAQDVITIHPRVE